MIPQERRQGYIQRWRYLYNSSIYSDLVAWRVFDYLESHCNWKTGILRDGTPIFAGQIATSRENLARETYLTVQQVRSALDHLKRRQLVSIKTTKRYTIVTLTNWSTEQGERHGEQPDDQPFQQPDNNPTSAQHQPDLNLRVTTIKKGNYSSRESGNNIVNDAREDDADVNAFEDAVLTALSPRLSWAGHIQLGAANRAICRRWYYEGVDLTIVKRAIVLGCLRRLRSVANRGGVDYGINSLSYFETLFPDARDESAGSTYWDRLEPKLAREEAKIRADLRSAQAAENGTGAA